MTFTASEKRQLKKAANRMFKGIENKPLHSLTPAIAYRDFWKTDMDILLYAPVSDHAKKFFNDRPKEISTIIEIIVKDTHNKGTKDLIFEIQLFPETDFPALKTCILGEDTSKMKDFLDALVKAKELKFFLSDKDHIMFCSQTIDWDYKPYKENIDEVYESLPEDVK